MNDTAPRPPTARSSPLLLASALLCTAGAAFVLRRPLMMSAPRCLAGRWHGCLETFNGVALITLVTPPLAVLVAGALAYWRRRAGCRRRGRRPAAGRGVALHPALRARQRQGTAGHLAQPLPPGPHLRPRRGGGDGPAAGVRPGRRLLPRRADTRTAHPDFRPQRGTRRVRTARRAGVGLGLAVAQSIVRAHKGTLDLSPRPDGGLLVTVELPGRGGRSTAAPARAAPTGPPVRVSSGWRR